MDADPDQRVSVMWQACLSLIEAACKLLFWKEKAQCPVTCLLYLPSSFVKMNRKIHFRWLILSRIHGYMEEETSADTQVCLWLGSAFHAIYMLGIFPFGLKLQSLLKLKLSVLWGFYFPEMKHIIMSLAGTAAMWSYRLLVFSFICSSLPPAFFLEPFWFSLKKIEGVADVEQNRIITGRAMLSQNTGSSGLD